MTFFKNWSIENVNSLGLSVAVYPTFEYAEIINAQRDEQTAETGNLSQHRLGGGSYRFDMPLSFVNSSDKQFIRNLWRDNQTFRMSQGGSDSIEYLDCRMINRNDPFQRYSDAQFNRFDGVMNLVSINDQNTARGLGRNIQQGSYFTLGTSTGILGINALA